MPWSRGVSQDGCFANCSSDDSYRSSCARSVSCQSAGRLGREKCANERANKYSLWCCLGSNDYRKRWSKRWGKQLKENRFKKRFVHGWKPATAMVMGVVIGITVALPVLRFVNCEFCVVVKSRADKWTCSSAN